MKMSSYIKKSTFHFFCIFSACKEFKVSNNNKRSKCIE